MIKKHQKEEFLDQVTNVVVNFFKKKELAATGTPKDDSQDFSIVDWFRGCDTLSPVDELKGDFEEFFRNYGILEDDRPLIEHLFSVFINGVKCEGVIAVKANDPDEAFVKAQDLVSNGLFEAFPSLDVEYSVEPIEEDGYPLFEVSAEKLPFSSESKIITTSDKNEAYKCFEEACKNNTHVSISVRTSSGASSAVLKQWEITKTD